MTPPSQASAFVTFGIAGLAILVAVMGIILARKAGTRSSPAWLAILAVMTLQYAVAASGILTQWDRTPPPFLPLIALTLTLAILTVVRWGKQAAATLSFAILIGSQAFRLPLEMVMHQAATEGVMPVQMSYSGRNFDILTGTSAIVVAVLAARGLAPRWLLLGWNLLGSLLLLNIVWIAAISTPLFHAFGDSQLNTWVAYPPFVWLPGVLVPAALLGHGILWRKLCSC